MTLSLPDVAAEVARDLRAGSYVNLGIGLPTTVAAYIDPTREVIVHCENGVLGAGPPAAEGEEDWDLVDAGKHAITLVAGGAFMRHSDSFAVIRGGHLDVAVMGAYQVSSGGDLANWSTGAGPGAVGGAMDLAAGAKAVHVMMRHDAKGEPKLVSSCTYPLTAPGVVTRVYTELGIFEPRGATFGVVGLAAGVGLAEVQAVTGAPLEATDEPLLLPRP